MLYAYGLIALQMMKHKKTTGGGGDLKFFKKGKKGVKKKKRVLLFKPFCTINRYFAIPCAGGHFRLPLCGQVGAGNLHHPFKYSFFA